MALSYVIPGKATGANIPILGFQQDQLLDGSLVYIEPAREGLSAVPALGDRLINWARGSLSDLTGADMDDLDATVTSVMTGAAGVMELTSKGALHGYVNKAVASSEEYRIALPAGLISYIHANNHAYYCDAILRGTQDPALHPSPPATPWMIGIQDGTTGGDVFFGLRNQADSDNSAGLNHLLWPASSFSFGEYNARDIWSAGNTSHARVALNALPADLGIGTVGEIRWVGAGNAGGTLYGGQGWIFHSLYIEDLTVSGRSYTEALAWRQAQYTADFASGGRYAGETWTDPAGVSWA